MLKKLILVTGLLLASQSVFAEMVVIVNPANANTLDAKKIQRIFLGKDKRFANSPCI